MADLVLKDVSTGQSKTYVPTAEGYAEFQADLQAAVSQGHQVAGSLDRAKQYFGENLWNK